MSTLAIGTPAPTAMHANGAADGSKPACLHSPPESNNAMDAEASDSELSDLDEVACKFDGVLEDELKDEPANAPTDAPAPEPQPEVDDIGEVFPADWSGNVPIFKPTMEQFKDFKRFMEKVDKYGMKSGIIKIVAPEEWRKNLPKLDEMVKQIRVREPIKQDIMGSNGTYRQVNILHQRSYNLPQWRQLCDQSEHQPPARRGERRANSDRKLATRSRAAAQPTTRAAPSTTPAKKRRGERATRRSTRAAKEETEEPEDRPMTPVSPDPEKEEVLDSVEKDAGVKEEHCEEEDNAPAPRRMGFSRQSKPKTQSTSARRKYVRREGSAMIDEAAFKDWDYRMDISEYTPERCEELEKTYWKTLTYAPPLYGADLMGTLFEESADTWNLNKLPNLLDVLGTKVPGVNTAYLYLGMWKATFAWHLEDVDLYSINYLHFGAPKQWYSISQADARRFEVAMKNIWPTEAKACDQFLRHKSFLISPSHLKQNYNITVNKCVSYPGEFVVTYPYGYHSGYNLGYNCAEAVNFALDSWLPMGKIAKKCQCAQAQDSVWVDVYEIERKLRGEETEYEETEDEEDEEDDDDDLDTGLPSPPSSHTVRGKAGRKRKRAANEKEGRAKTKKIRLRLKPHVEPPCCLCPNDIPGAEIMPTDDGRKAHRMCALYLPETYIETVDDKEIIANVAGIDKARLDLKCLYCRSKKGACFQCSQKKCPRSYHATCAAAAGVFVEEGEVPVFGEDGTEYKEQAFEFSCRFHRTKRDRKSDGDILEANEQIRAAAKALKKNDICQLQYYRGEIFAGVVVENRPDEETLLLEIIPSGETLEVEWKWLLVPDPADLRLPKASPNAIPLPTCRKTQKEINAKRAVDEAPRKDDEFGPGLTWAEFHAGDPIKNREQVKIDFAKENQVWHYLGKTSTEAKAQYTESLSRPWHNPKGNFLETIPKPPPPVRMAPQPRPVFHGAYPVYQHSHGMPQGGMAIKQERPYVYKPRNPVATTAGANSTPFTSHTFALNAPSPAPAPQHFQPQQVSPQQPPFHTNFQHHHVFPQQHIQPQPQQQQQHQQQAPLQVKQYQPSSADVHQRKGSSAAAASYSLDRFAPVGGSNGFPSLSGLAWPPAHMKSGHSVQNHHHHQARASPLPQIAPMTSSALRPNGGGGGQQSGGGGEGQGNGAQRDPSGYRAPYGHDPNMREFMIKAQKALSGGSSKGPAKQIPTLQPRPGPSTASPGGHGSPYAQILPRPPAQAGQTPSPRPLAAAPGPYPPPYQNQGHYHHPPPNEFRQPGSAPLHSAVRPQYQPQPPQQHAQQQHAQQHHTQQHHAPQHHAHPPHQHHHQQWQAPPQPSTIPFSAPPHPAQGKKPFTKQSHSPIPLPPYVKQMNGSKPSPLGNQPWQQQHQQHQQAAPQQHQQQHPPAQNPFASPAPPTQPIRAAPPRVQASASPPQQTGGQQQQSPSGPAAQVPGPQIAAVPGPAAVVGQSSNGQAVQAPPPPAAQRVTAGVSGDGGNGASGGAQQDGEAALVQKMMMNLRRASQNLGTGKGEVGEGGEKE